jgi:hypothetical protein
LLGPPDFLLGARDVLDMVPDLVRQNVRLRKITCCSKSAMKLVEECKVDVDPLVGRAVKRPHRRLTDSASRLRRVPEEHEASRLVLRIVARHDLSPGVLRVVEHERNELDLRLLAR